MQGSSKTAPADEDVADWMDEEAVEGEEGTGADKTEGGEARTGDGEVATVEGKTAKKEQADKEEDTTADVDEEGDGTI